MASTNAFSEPNPVIRVRRTIECGSIPIPTPTAMSSERMEGPCEDW
jgi:hypothetical protein